MGEEDRGTEIERLEWVSHPARERPGATALLLFIMLLAAATAVAVGENLWWGILGFALLFLSMWSYFLPSRFVLDSEGVSKRSLFGEEKKSWKQVRKVIPDSYGVLLSPFPHSTRLAKFRGLSVQFSGNREEVLGFIRDRIGAEPGID